MTLLVRVKNEIKSERKEGFVSDFEDGKKGAISKNRSLRRGQGLRSEHGKKGSCEVVRGVGKEIPVEKAMSNCVVIRRDSI